MTSLFSTNSFSVSITRGPYLQKVTTSSITIVWRTDVAANTIVDYADEEYYNKYGNYNKQFTDANSVIQHAAQLDGLQISTVYHYKVTSNGAFSQDNTFRTSPYPKEPFAFISYGDTRCDATICTDKHPKLIDRMLTMSPKPYFVLNVGDLVYDGDQTSEWDFFFNDALKDLIKSTPYYVTLGNHEHYSDNYFNYFYLPEAPSLGQTNGQKEAYYSFDYGNVHVISLDVEKDTYGEAGNGFLPGTPQYNWLVSDLSSVPSDRYKIIFFHHPPYNSGVSHGCSMSLVPIGCCDPPNSQEKTLVDHLVPLFEQYGVNIVFAGHEHSYERAPVWQGQKNLNGVQYVQTSGGGPMLSASLVSCWHTVKYERNHHFTYLTSNGSQLKFEAIDIDGNKFDEFTITASGRDDTTAPSTPVVTDDSDYTSDKSKLHATWSSDDSDSGIDEYQYAVGTACRGTDIVNWTSNGRKNEITVNGNFSDSAYIVTLYSLFGRMTKKLLGKNYYPANGQKGGF